MGLFDRMRAELVDVIEWLDDTHHALVWRFPRYANEIKHGAQLIVRPGQAAVFVDRGKIADVFSPGHYTLDTANLPLLSTLQAWKHGFNSPFKSEVYFVRTTQVTGLKWGTPQPVMMRDADFGPIRIRAFGTFNLKAIDPRILIKELVGTDGMFDVEEVQELLRSLINGAVAEEVAKSEIAALDLAQNYQTLGDAVRANVCEKIDDEYGLEVPFFQVVNISLPEEVQKALDTKTSMGVIGDMQEFQQFQLGKSMLAAAERGGTGNEGLAMGMGLAMANQFAPQMMGGGHPAPPPGPQMMAPPPLPPPSMFHVALGGQPQGPFALEQVVQGIQSGQITAATTVWQPGMPSWTSAGQVPTLARYFGAQTPPPLPPPLGGEGS